MNAFAGATTAVLFPGQGSQTSDMRELAEGSWPELLELAVSELGTDPFDHVDEGTRFAQPALYCASLAGWSRIAEEVEAEETFLAGHSLGEFAALVAAGSLSPGDGLRLVALRGRLMQEAAEHRPDGGMLAVMADRQAASGIASRAGVVVANDNSPGQVVLSGHVPALDEAAADADAQGLRAVRLAVHGAFHSPAMESAVPMLRAALDAVEFAPPRMTVFSSVTAAPFDDVRRRLAEALTQPVRWRETLDALHERGVVRFVETGPGRVLSGLVRKTLDGVETVSAESLVAARG